MTSAERPSGTRFPGRWSSSKTSSAVGGVALSFAADHPREVERGAGALDVDPLGGKVDRVDGAQLALGVEVKIDVGETGQTESGYAKALKSLMRGAREAVAKGGQVLIFPEGTRKPKPMRPRAGRR